MFDFKSYHAKEGNPLGCTHRRSHKPCTSEGAHHPGCPKLTRDLARFKENRRQWELKGGFHGKRV